MVELGPKDDEDMSARQRTTCSKVYIVEEAWHHSGARRTWGADGEHGVKGAWSPLAWTTWMIRKVLDSLWHVASKGARH